MDKESCSCRWPHRSFFDGLLLDFLLYGHGLFLYWCDLRLLGECAALLFLWSDLRFFSVCAAPLTTRPFYGSYFVDVLT